MAGIHGVRKTTGTLNFHLLPKVFLDAETTGDSLANGGEICEIGLEKIHPVTLETIDRLHLMFEVKNPRGRTEAELSFNGYNGFAFAEWTAHARPVGECLNRLNEFARDCSPWGYNIHFEYRWLDPYYDQYGVDWVGDYHWHDIMPLATELLKPDFLAGKIQTLTLSDVGEYLGLGREATPHRGPGGAQYEVEVYRELSARLDRMRSTSDTVHP